MYDDEWRVGHWDVGSRNAHLVVLVLNRFRTSQPFSLTTQLLRMFLYDPEIPQTWVFA